MPHARWHLARLLLVIALALRLIWLVARWQLGADDVHGYHVQTAAVWWMLAVALAIAWSRRSPAAAPPSGVNVPAWLLPLTIAGAVLLYARALGIGFLSDDFILRAQALHGNLRSLSAGAFRPLPLALWAIVLHVSGGAVALHAINVVLHGVNAWLGGRLAMRWTGDRAIGVATAAFVLVNPLAVEPVAWSSGIFDVLAVTCVLAAVLVVPMGPAPPGRWVMFGVFACAAVLSKETAVMLPALVACDALARRDRRAAVAAAIGISALLAGIYALVRLYAAFGVASPPFSRYVMQRALFSAFGSLAAPAHERVVHAAPWLAIAAVVLVVVLVTWACAIQGGRSRIGVAIAALLWILASTLPVFPILVVGADLQASRYLYLAAPAWAFVLAWLGQRCAASSHRARPVAYGLLTALVAIDVALAWQHVSPWRDAAATRDVVLVAARTDPAMRACPAVTARDLPDHVGGAYVFRNGAPEAFAESAGITLVLDAPASCTFAWRADAGRFANDPSIRTPRRP